MLFKDSLVEAIGGALPLDIKALSEDGQFEGYASTFGNKDFGGDIVQAGAFAKSLKKRPARSVKMLWQHDPSQPIGVWQSAKEDDTGLLMKGQLLTSTMKGGEAYQFMKAGVVDGLSIGFRPVTWKYDKSGSARLLEEVDLLEVSCVTFPMNPKATVTAVKSDGLTPRLVEKALRDAGYSRAEAMKVVSSIKHLLRDAEDEPDHDLPRDADGLSDLLASLRERASILTP